MVRLEPLAVKGDEVLNGIAFDPFGQEFLLTGKRWRQFYLIEAF